MKSQITQYPKVISSIYDSHKPAHVVSVSNTQRLAAIGLASEVRIVRVDGPTGITDMCSYSNSPAKATITDISWSTVDIGKLAIAYSNGSITCLNVAEKASRQSQILSEEWSSGKVSTGVNRISWHPVESNTIASANQDGIVRIFDFRIPQTAAKVSTYGQRALVATKDIEFDPFHSEIFAEVSENGSIKIWDRRNQSKPLVNKTKAHSGPILSVSWSPCWEWVLATGSKDKTVKIWDFSACSAVYEPDESQLEGLNVFTSAVAAITQQATGAANANSSTKESIEPSVVNTLYTPSEVLRLKWSITNTSTGNGSTSIAPLLATITTGSGVTAESAGHILVWDLLNQHIPLCILKGHGQDMCADFSWLNHSIAPTNTLTSSLSTATFATTSSATTATTTTASTLTSSNQASSSARRGGRNSNKPETRRKSQSVDSQLAAAADKASAGGDLSPTKQLNPVTSLVLDVLSAGRDGKILMQDLRYGYFPNHHISPSVTAISSQGHVAFQRGYVHKKFSTSVRSPYYFADFSSYIAALTMFRKRAAPEVVPRPLSLLKPSESSESLISVTAKASASASNTSSGAHSKNKAAAASAPLAPEVPVAQERRSGVVFFGSQTISSLEDAKRIRLERGAEARVTDPALIALFAKKYRVPYTLDPEHELVVDRAHQLAPEKEMEFANRQEQDLYLWKRNAEKVHRRALAACKINLEVAVAAGLHCRVAVWTTLLSLLPPPSRPVTAQQEEEVTLIGGRSSPHPLLGVTYSDSPLNSSDDPDSPVRVLRREVSVCKIAPKVAPRNAFPELPFTLELIGTLLSELLEGGDVQHFVVACEIIRSGGILPAVCQAVKLSDTRVQRGYLVYLDLLTKLGLFCEATDLLKATEDTYMCTLNQVGVQVGLKCSGCGKELSSDTSTGWCERCVRCVSVCVICNKPAGGLIQWCPVCAHGGHLSCTKRWFRQSDDCPAGCGHNCCGSLLEKHADLITHAPSGQPVLGLQEHHKRAEWLRGLDYCLGVSAQPRSRSNSRSNILRVSSSAVPSVATKNDFEISSRTLQRQQLRRKKIATLQGASS